MKNLVPLIVAVVLGVLAVIGVSRYMRRMEQQFIDENRPKEVVVAGKDIKAGQRFSSDMLALRSFPERMIPAQAVTPQDFEDIIGQPAARDFFAGEPLLWTGIGTPAKEKRLSDSLKTGERAVTLNLSQEACVDCYIKPNDKVDIIVTMDVPYMRKVKVPDPQGNQVTMEEETSKKVTVMLLQNVTLLATGSSFDQDMMAESGDFTSVTLALSIEECMLLEFVKKQGDISFMLRNPEDFSTLPQIEKVDMDTILDMTKLNAVNEARNKRIERYHRGKKSVITTPVTEAVK